MRTVYGIPPELQYNKVLFVEKRGFNTMLNESGTLDRFNMGVSRYARLRAASG
jgi:hypothetical protein